MAEARPERYSSNPKEFPVDKVPNYIIKMKNGHFHFYMREPDAGRNYLWYMSDVKCGSVAELEEAMRVPGRRWFANDKDAYKLQLKTGASTTDGEPYVCLRNIRNWDQYYYGKRHADPPPEKTMIVVTVAELFLKSALHQKRLVRILIDQMKRVVDNTHVFRCGNTMIEIRKTMPTPEQMDLLALLPGIAKIYEGVHHESGGDPRGACIRDGAGGVPIVPEQRALTLMSGGIDSPVAAYCMMTRGCHVSGIHFLNSTNDTAAVMAKNRLICQKLARVQGRFEMYYVDISKLQSQIVAQVPNLNRTLIYKWFMLSLAAGFDESLFVVTGDSAGQVASQTVHNISTLYPTIRKAVISPLIGMSKAAIMAIAHTIGTFQYSIQEGADCCQYMMCKTGANLCIGRRSLEACVRRITLSPLPVQREVFRNGELVETTQFTFTPSGGLRSAEDDGKVKPATKDAAAPEEDVVYFDAAAGTKMAESVRIAMMHAPEGNPNSMHQSGREARMAVEQARSELARVMGVPATDIIFTSGGTESNNIALHGYRVVRDAWSHASTSENEAAVAADAVTVRVVDLVNHETGSVAPELRRPPGGRLHLDASQALTKIDFSKLDLSEVDSITVTAHKINGPVGAGAVYLRGLECHPLYSGGSQEKGIRPGTENVPAIVGFAAALRLDRSASVHREIEAYMVEELQSLGCDINRRGETSGYIVHATLPEGFVNTDVVTRLSTQYHVEIGTGSACKTGEVNTTVYDTLGKKPEPKRSIRISWDSFATMLDAEKVVEALGKVLRSNKSNK